MSKAFFKKPLKVRIVRGFLLALVISALAAFIPTPYWVLAPGRAEEVSAMVRIETETFPVTGSFLLPTVVSEPATLLFCLYTFLEPDAVLTTEAALEPMAQTPPEENQMALSQYISSMVALEALGHTIRGDFAGLRVVGLTDDSPNRGVLQNGDLLLRLGSEPLRSFGSFRQKVEALKPGESAELTVNRDGRELTVRVRGSQREGRTVLGLLLRPEWLENPFPFPIAIDTGTTVGASGGLVFALEIYDRLTPEDLTRGRRIAATGTLDPGGNVGPVQGVPFKLKGAERVGADILLYPRENEAEVAGASGAVEVIPVGSFKEALDVLRR